MQLVPESLELQSLLVIEHEFPELIVFAIKERQRDDLIDGHDLGVTQSDREKIPEAIKGLLDSGLG